MKILLVDDHQMFCEGLRSLLEEEPDIEIAGTAGDGRTAVQLAERLRPDVVIMDVGMPELNGIEATRQIRLKVPRVKVVALSIYGDPHHVSEMLTAGASAYLLKEGVYAELVNAVRQVHAGKGYLSPAIANLVIDSFAKLVATSPRTGASVLTAREREVLRLLAEGRSTSAISKQLRISVKTVECHRRHLMVKLELHSIAELTRYAIYTGIASLAAPPGDS